MPIFERGAVVRVPFPYTERPVRQHRPALVVSDGGIGDGGKLLWVVMITSAENRRWPDDIPLTDTYAEVGLPAPSLLRPAKIATIEAEHAERLGGLDAGLLSQVERILARQLGLKR